VGSDSATRLSMLRRGDRVRGERKGTSRAGIDQKKRWEGVTKVESWGKEESAGRGSKKDCERFRGGSTKSSKLGPARKSR